MNGGEKNLVFKKMSSVGEKTETKKKTLREHCGGQ